MASARARLKPAFQMANKAGVKIAFGTDAGGFDHGRNARDFSSRWIRRIAAGSDSERDDYGCRVCAH